MFVGKLCVQNRIFYHSASVLTVTNCHKLHAATLQKKILKKLGFHFYFYFTYFYYFCHGKTITDGEEEPEQLVLHKPNTLHNLNAHLDC